MKSVAIALPILAFACLTALAQTPPAAQRGVETSAGQREPVGPVPGPRPEPPAMKNPYAGDDAALQSGRKLFVSFNCSGCHGGHAGGGMGPSLRDSVWFYGGDGASIYASVTEGRQHGMPAWGPKVPQDQRWKIVTYIQSLRTPDEPDPPR